MMLKLHRRIFQQAVDTVCIKESVAEDRHSWLPNTLYFMFLVDLTKPDVTIVCVGGFN